MPVCEPWHGSIERQAEERGVQPSLAVIQPVLCPVETQSCGIGVYPWFSWRYLPRTAALEAHDWVVVLDLLCIVLTISYMKPQGRKFLQIWIPGNGLLPLRNWNIFSLWTWEFCNQFCFSFCFDCLINTKPNWLFTFESFLEHSDEHFTSPQTRLSVLVYISSGPNF